MLALLPGSGGPEVRPLACPRPLQWEPAGAHHLLGHPGGLLSPSDSASLTHPCPSQHCLTPFPPCIAESLKAVTEDRSGCRSEYGS